jgi:hypothetical protein
VGKLLQYTFRMDSNAKQGIFIGLLLGALIVGYEVYTGGNSSKEVEDQSIVQDQSLVGKLRDVGTICVPWTDPAKYMCDMTYDLTNNSDEPVEINGFVFLRVDSRTYQADSSDQYSNATDYISATLNPGQTKWARTSFQVPTDGKIMQLWIGSLDLKKVVISIDALAETFDN